MYEIVQIFLIATLLVIAYTIARRNLKAVNPIQVAIPTMVLVTTFFILDNLIKNFLVKFTITMIVYFVSFYLIKFLLENREITKI